MNSEAIKQHLPAMWEELAIEIYEEISSTNDWAKQQAKEKITEEMLIISKTQTKGRGRNGRNFYSALDHGLYFSLVIHPQKVAPADLPMYTIAAATALMQAVETISGLTIQVKWVNDLFYNNRKIAGILTEAITDSRTNQISALVLGVGLNLAGSFADADDLTQEVAGTLYEELPENFDINELLQQFLIAFGPYHQDLARRQFLPLYEKKLLGIGQEVSYERKNQIYQGTIRGVNQQGQLLVENKQGEQEALLGEEIHFSSEQFRKEIGE